MERSPDLRPDVAPEGEEFDEQVRGSREGGGMFGEGQARGKGGAGGRAGMERLPDLRPDDAPQGGEFDEQVRRGGEGERGRV